MTRTNDAEMIEIVIHSPSQHVEDGNGGINESKWRRNGLFTKVIVGLLFIAVTACIAFCYQLMAKTKESRKLHSNAEIQSAPLAGEIRAKERREEEEERRKRELRQSASCKAVALRWNKLDKSNTRGTCSANAVYAILHADRYFADFQQHKFPKVLEQAKAKKRSKNSFWVNLFGSTDLEWILIDWGNAFLHAKSLNDIWTKTYHALVKLNDAQSEARYDLWKKGEESEQNGNLDGTTIPVDISKNLNEEQWKDWTALDEGFGPFNIPGYEEWIQYVNRSAPGMPASLCFMHFQILTKALYYMAYESDVQFEKEFSFIYVMFDGIPGTMFEEKRFVSRLKKLGTDFPTEFNRAMEENPNIPSITLSNPFPMGHDNVDNTFEIFEELTNLNSRGYHVSAFSMSREVPEEDGHGVSVVKNSNGGWTLWDNDKSKRFGDAESADEAKKDAITWLDRGNGKAARYQIRTVVVQKNE